MRPLSCCALLALFTLRHYEVSAFAPASSIVCRRRQQPSSVVTFRENNSNGDSESPAPDNDEAQDSKKPRVPATPDKDDESTKSKSLIPENSLVLPTAVLGFIAVATQAGAYSAFFDSLAQMKENMAANPTDFWPAVNFCIFFVAGHAILQPIFWTSEVLHASPGPMVGDLVPISFIVGNVVVIAAFTFIKEVRLRQSS